MFKHLDFYKRAFIFLFILELVSCATPRETRSPSALLLSSDKKSHVLLKDLKDVLEENRYDINVYNKVLGVISTKPRYFKYESKNGLETVQHEVQIRQEGASIKLNIFYKCSIDKVSFRPCYKDEATLNDKIYRIDSKLVRIIKDSI